MNKIVILGDHTINASMIGGCGYYRDQGAIRGDVEIWFQDSRRTSKAADMRLEGIESADYERLVAAMREAAPTEVFKLVAVDAEGEDRRLPLWVKLSTVSAIDIQDDDVVDDAPDDDSPGTIQSILVVADGETHILSVATAQLDAFLVALGWT